MADKKLKDVAFQRQYWDTIAARGPDSVLDPYDSRGAKNRYLRMTRDDTMVEFATRAGGSLTLDLGCGSGAVTRLLEDAGLPAVGADISFEMLKMARTVVSSPLVHISGVDLPFKTGSIGSAMTYGVLVYLCEDEDMMRLLHEVRRVLQPGARFLAIEQSSARSRTVEDGLKRQRSVAEYEALFEAAGLRLVEVKQARGGHFPLLYLVRVGVLPESSWTVVRNWDRRYARSVLSWFDYRDTAFECVVD